MRSCDASKKVRSHQIPSARIGNALLIPRARKRLIATPPHRCSESLHVARRCRRTEPLPLCVLGSASASASPAYTAAAQSAPLGRMFVTSLGLRVHQCSSLGECLSVLVALCRKLACNPTTALQQKARTRPRSTVAILSWSSALCFTPPQCLHCPPHHPNNTTLAAASMYEDVEIPLDGTVAKLQAGFGRKWQMA